MSLASSDPYLGAGPQSGCCQPQMNRTVPTISVICSVFGCLNVIVSYCVSKRMRRHPNVYMLNRSLCDLAFLFLLLISFYGNGDSNVFYCNAAIAVLTQITLFASLLYYFAMPVDMYYTIMHPFSSPQVFTKQVNVFIWTASICTGIFQLTKNVDGLGFGFCWICFASAKRDVLGLYIVWVSLIVLLGGVMAAVIVYKCYKGDTSVSFTQLINQVYLSWLVYFVIFTVYWVLVITSFGLEFSYKTTGSCSENRGGAENAFVACMALCGVVDALLVSSIFFLHILFSGLLYVSVRSTLS